MFRARRMPAHRGLLVISLFVLLAVLMAAPVAMAGCKNGKGKCNPPPPPNNNPPSPGAASMLLDDSYISGDFDTVGEAMAIASQCDSGANNTAANGDYFCSTVSEIWFRTATMTGVFSNKYRNLCGSLQLGVLLTGDEVSFGWNDDCTDDGNCAVEIRVLTSDPDILGATGGAADVLDLVFNGSITGYTGSDTNPFKSSQSVRISSLDLVFLKPGSTRTAGTCTFYPNWDITRNPLVPDLYFEVTPH